LTGSHPALRKEQAFRPEGLFFAATRCRQIEVAADGHQQDDQGSAKALRRAYRVSAGVEEDRRSEYISIDRQGTGHGGLSLVFCCSVVRRGQAACGAIRGALPASLLPGQPMPAGRHIAVPEKSDALPDIRQQEILQTHDTDAVFIPHRKAIQRNHIFGIVIGNLQQIVCLAG